MIVQYGDACTDCFLLTFLQFQIYYDMTSRGRAIIMSHEKYHDSMRNRRGNEKDEARMAKLLKELHFDVEVWNDKTHDVSRIRSRLVTAYLRFEEHY